MCVSEFAGFNRVLRKSMYTIMSVIHLLLSLLVNVTHLCLAEIGVPPKVVPYVVGVRRSCQGSQVVKLLQRRYNLPLSLLPLIWRRISPYQVYCREVLIITFLFYFCMKLMHKYTLKDFAATAHILESLKISYR